MVEVRIARAAVEAMADSPPGAAVQRIDAQVAAEDSGSDTVQVARVAVEVMAASPSRVNVHRQDAQVAAEDSGSDTVQVARVSTEVMAKTPPGVAVQRLDAQVAAEDSGSDELRVARVAVEVMARRGVPAPVPLTLNTSDLFFNNWHSTRVQVESTYLNDITRSPDKLTEERRALGQRPARSIRVLWTHANRTQLDRLRVFLRDMTQQEMQLPLYCDGTPLTVSALSADTSINLATDNRRFFLGGRVALVPIDDLDGYSASPIIRQVSDLKSGEITLDSSIGQDITAQQWMVFPLIDCDKHLGPELAMSNDRTSSFILEFTEHKGRNSLPPIATGFPDGWPMAFDDKPIFVPKHNWREQATTTYKRYGDNKTSGRKVRPSTDGERYVQVQDYKVTMTRAEFWPILQMFDTRLGRNRAFWAVDQETQWQLSDTDPTFIDVQQFGTFADFDQLWTDDGIAAAIVMKDGTVYLRTINSVQDNGGSWRLTLTGGQTLPDPIDLTQVDYFARARDSRFERDGLVEQWYTDDVVEAQFSIIEVPNESTLDIDPD